MQPQVGVSCLLHVGLLHFNTSTAEHQLNRKAFHHMPVVNAEINLQTFTCCQFQLGLLASCNQHAGVRAHFSSMLASIHVMCQRRDEFMNDHCSERYSTLQYYSQA
jgi:hypothetical protein